MSDDQRNVIAFLSDPSSYEHGVDRVETIETHASLIFLASDRAYKLKRAVKYPYLDFSTVELRRQACEAELALNRRTAPALYEEIRGLFRNAAGGISFSPQGRAVDWVVVMRRFDQALVFDALARTGGLGPRVMDELADHIASFHAATERRSDSGGAAEMAQLAEIQHRCLAGARRAGFPPADVESILEKWRRALAAVAQLLDDRRAAGKVRRCHGDLHLRNICLVDGKPTLFDCLEFDDGLATIDVLYDLAFLLMDLEYRGLPHFANRVLNRYLDRTEEDDGLAAMPLFLSLRAGIRGHVVATSLEHAAAWQEMAAEARRYLQLAHRLLEPEPRRLIAIGGVSGTGKSTLAVALAPEVGRRPGARLLRSDVTRKLLYGVAPETPLPAAAYSREVSRRVYETLRRKAAAALAAGYSAIIDAVSLRPDERRAFAEVARAAKVPFSGLWLEGSPEILAGRISARHGDASDATPEILSDQLRHGSATIEWTRLDAGVGPAECLATARRVLGVDARNECERTRWRTDVCSES
ncbi:MAG TPA: AAA family ATPase [Stellaceae bacterium]|nr:AAA family ATPase [Stellaceae bacterium]